METTQLAWDDIAWAVRRLPRPIKDLLQRHGARVFLAGGYLRSVIARERVADVDLFTSSKDYAEACAKELAAPPGRKARRLIETENAYTVVMQPFPAQFIHRWVFDCPADALASFDFTVAQAALWWDSDELSWRGVCATAFYPDLAAKRLVYTRPERDEAPGGSMLRVLKFYQREYRIPLDSLASVIARLACGVDANSKVPLEQALLGLLREVDPLIDPDHAAHLPARDETDAD